MATTWVIGGPAPAGVETRELTKASKRRLTLRLDDAPSAEFEIDGRSNEVAGVVALSSDLHVYHNGTKIFRGRFGPEQDSVEATTHRTKFTAIGYRGMLNARKVGGAGAGVLLPGTVGNHISTPDSSLIDVVGDLEVVVHAKANWQGGGALQILAAKDNASTQRSWGFYITTTGFLDLYTFPAAADHISTVALPFLNGTAWWVKATIDVDNGAGGRTVKFWYAPDQLTEPTSWTQLGANVTVGATTTITNSTAPLWIGARANGTGDGFTAGTFYRVILRAGIDGTKACDFLPDNAAPAATSWVSQITGETWTLNGTAALTAANQTPLAFVQTDQGRIAWDVITSTQQCAGGNWGITNGIGPTSGTLRDRSTYDTGKPLGDIISELGRVDGGFEWEIDAALALNRWYPTRGSTKGTIDYGGLLTKVQRTLTPADFGNVAIASGDPNLTTPVTAVASGVASDVRGRWEVSQGYATVKEQTTVSSKATWLLAQVSTLRPDYVVTFAQGRWKGPTDIWLGDTVTLSVNSGRLSVAGQFRVIEIQLSWGENGEETVTMGLMAA